MLTGDGKVTISRKVPEWFVLYVCCSLGVFTELCFFTLVETLEGRSYLTLETKTYLWVIPIWGCGLYLADKLVHHKEFPRWYHRYLPYALYYFVFEYLTGALLYFLIGKCPWDYSSSGYDAFHCHGFARIDYSLAAPAVMFFLVEPTMNFLKKFTLIEEDIIG